MQLLLLLDTVCGRQDPAATNVRAAASDAVAISDGQLPWKVALEETSMCACVCIHTHARFCIFAYVCMGTRVHIH